MCVNSHNKNRMTHQLRVVKNCTTHPLPRVQNLMTHPLTAPTNPPPPILFDQSLTVYCVEFNTANLSQTLYVSRSLPLHTDDRAFKAAFSA